MFGISGKFVATKLFGRTGEFAADVVQKNNGDNRLLVDAQSSPAPLGQLITQNALHNGSADLNIDGRSEVVFEVPKYNEDLVVSRLSFYGRDNGIEFGAFLALWNELSNGIIVEVKSEDQIFQFRPIKTTDDFRNIWSIMPSDFVLDKISGDDAFTAVLQPRAPFYIRKQSTFSSPDYIRVKIRDDIHKVNYLQFLITGALQ